MPKMMAAPKKAPIVWKRKYMGNFLQRSLPSRHRAKVTAGFRWPPANVHGDNVSAHIIDHEHVVQHYLNIDKILYIQADLSIKGRKQVKMWFCKLNLSEKCNAQKVFIPMHP